MDDTNLGFNRYLTKLAKTAADAKSAKERGEKLSPHQESALSLLDKEDGVILHHSTGSGKTKTFLTAIARQQARDKGGRSLIVAPASLVSNVDKEIDKHGLKIDRKRLDVYSYEKATRMADELASKKYSIAIADEAQRLRNSDTKRSKALSDIFSNADKRLLATATANFNHSADIAPLINMARGEKILPEDRKEFEKIFVGKEKKPRKLIDMIMRRPAEEVDVLKNSNALNKVFEKHVHYYDSSEDPAAKDKFPTVTESTHEVEMSPKQQRLYKFLEGELPFWLRMKVRHNLPLDKQEKAQLNSFSSGIRQVSNSTRHLVQERDDEDYSPKVSKAVENLKKKMAGDKNFRGLVYSNYLDAGIHEYSRKLSEEGIPHVVFSGQLSKSEKDEAVKQYNAGKVKALLVSSSGAEGLDLKGTKLTQILEPHFNPSKIKQVKGRGARFESHAHLPKEERTMEVEHYLTTHPKSILGSTPTSIDKYLSGMSDDKQAIFDQIKRVMKNASKTSQDSR